MSDAAFSASSPPSSQAQPDIDNRRVSQRAGGAVHRGCVVLLSLLMSRQQEQRMAEPRKSAGGGKRMGKAGTARKRAEKPVLGEAALKEALAGFKTSPEAAGGSGAAQGASPNGSHAAAGAATAEPPPKTVSQVLGEITWLMTQSPRHKALALGDLEWLVMPAILLKQFRLFYKGDQPVGVALWALVDATVAKRIDAGDNRLTAAEWKSGSQMRIVDIVAPFGGEAEMGMQIASISTAV
jgi:cytolysin-activating lysine-acyltransferase